MKVEAKQIDLLAAEAIKDTAYAHAENLHLFTIGFKKCIRMIQGVKVVRECTKTCTRKTCKCPIPQEFNELFKKENLAWIKQER